VFSPLVNHQLFWTFGFEFAYQKNSNALRVGYEEPQDINSTNNNKTMKATSTPTNSKKSFSIPTQQGSLLVCDSLLGPK